jgi:hypothetical protein
MAFEAQRVGGKGMPSSWIEGGTLRALESIVRQLDRRDILAPYVVSLSFVDVQGYSLLTNDFGSHRSPAQLSKKAGSATATASVAASDPAPAAR